MQRSSESHAGKLVFAIIIMVAFMGFGIFAAWLDINHLPTNERAVAWIWFTVGCVLTTAISFGAYLPGFLNNRIAPQTRRQQAETMAMAKRVGYRATGLALLASSLGLMGPGFMVAIGALTTGLFTWVLGLIALMFFTKRGRAMRARQLALNRGEDPGLR